MTNKTEMRMAMRRACPSVPGDLLDHALDAALALPSSVQKCGACPGCTDGCRLERESPPCAPADDVRAVVDEPVFNDPLYNAESDARNAAAMLEEVLEWFDDGVGRSPEEYKLLKKIRDWLNPPNKQT